MSFPEDGRKPQPAVVGNMRAVEPGFSAETLV